MDGAVREHQVVTLPGTERGLHTQDITRCVSRERRGNVRTGKEHPQEGLLGRVHGPGFLRH